MLALLLVVLVVLVLAVLVVLVLAILVVLCRCRLCLLLLWSVPKIGRLCVRSNDGPSVCPSVRPFFRSKPRSFVPNSDTALMWLLVTADCRLLILCFCSALRFLARAGRKNDMMSCDCDGCCCCCRRRCYCCCWNGDDSQGMAQLDM